MRVKELKIENFGPIKGGYSENNGFLLFPKVTLFCGSQGVGKSCVAKLFSIFSWLEKALVRGDFSLKYLTEHNRFVKEHCAYQKIENYFSGDTLLHYHGSAFEMEYRNGRLNVFPMSNMDYLRPQIVYIPAERNLLSVIENVENMKGEPRALASLREVYWKALRHLKADVELPINHVHFSYDKLNRVSWVKTPDYKVRLAESSSGMQSVTPMFLVLDYLSRNLMVNHIDLSIKEKEMIQKRVEELLADDQLDVSVRKLLLEKVADTSNSYLLGIVEEPEQNLFPSSQRSVLNSLLAFSLDKDSQLVMTTHSPYILNYLSLSIKAEQVARSVKDPDLIARLDRVVPTPSQVNGDDVIVYQIDETGKINSLPKYDNMPSDANYLNNYLADSNELFNELLDIEELCR